jgi:hypothetical protein
MTTPAFASRSCKLVAERQGHFLDVAAQGDLVFLAVVVRIATGDVAQSGLALGSDVPFEIVDVEHRLRRILNAPNDDRRDLDRVPTLVVDLQRLAVERAGAQGDLVTPYRAAVRSRSRRCRGMRFWSGRFRGSLGRRRGCGRAALAVGVERIAPVKATFPHGPFVGAEQHQHARLVGLQREESAEQDDPRGDPYERNHQRKDQRMTDRLYACSDGVDEKGDVPDDEGDEQDQKGPPVLDMDGLLAVDGDRARSHGFLPLAPGSPADIQVIS